MRVGERDARSIVSRPTPLCCTRRARPPAPAPRLPALPPTPPWSLRARGAETDLSGGRGGFAAPLGPARPRARAAASRSALPAPCRPPSASVVRPALPAFVPAWAWRGGGRAPWSPLPSGAREMVPGNPPLPSPLRARSPCLLALGGPLRSSARVGCALRRPLPAPCAPCSRFAPAAGRGLCARGRRAGRVSACRVSGPGAALRVRVPLSRPARPVSRAVALWGWGGVRLRAHAPKRPPAGLSSPPAGAVARLTARAPNEKTPACAGGSASNLSLYAVSGDFQCLRQPCPYKIADRHLRRLRLCHKGFQHFRRQPEFTAFAVPLVSKSAATIALLAKIPPFSAHFCHFNPPFLSVFGASCRKGRSALYTARWMGPFARPSVPAGRPPPTMIPQLVMIMQLFAVRCTEICAFAPTYRRSNHVS